MPVITQTPLLEEEHRDLERRWKAVRAGGGRRKKEANRRMFLIYAQANGQGKHWLHRNMWDSPRGEIIFIINLQKKVIDETKSTSPYYKP